MTKNTTAQTPGLVKKALSAYCHSRQKKLSYNKNGPLQKTGGVYFYYIVLGTIYIYMLFLFSFLLV